MKRFLKKAPFAEGTRESGDAGWGKENWAALFGFECFKCRIGVAP